MQHHLFDSRFERLRQVNLKGTAPLTVVIAIYIYDWKGTVDVV